MVEPVDAVPCVCFLETRALRILFVIDNLRPGGAQKVILDIVRALKTPDASAAVWCLGGVSDYESKFTALGVPVLGARGVAHRNLTQFFALFWYVWRQDVTVVHTHLFHADLAGRIAGKVARFLNFLGKRKGLPVVLGTVHATNKRNRRWQYWLQRLSAPLADSFVSVSQRTHDYAVQYEGIRRDKARVIPNGIDSSPFDLPHESSWLRAELGLDENAILIGTMGRLHEQKGLEYLIRAAKQVVEARPTAHFIVVGYGPLRDALEAQTAELGIEDKMHFLGYRTDVPRILAALDVFVQPSLWEGMSIAIFEAMAAAQPVVATDVDGNVDQVVEGETGLLVPPADADALADALIRMTGDLSAAREMGEQGHARVEEEFPIWRMTDAYLDLYDELLTEKAGLSTGNWR